MYKIPATFWLDEPLWTNMGPWSLWIRLFLWKVLFFSLQLIYKHTFAIQSPICKLGAACKLEVHRVEAGIFDWLSILWPYYATPSHTATQRPALVLFPHTTQQLRPVLWAAGPPRVDSQAQKEVQGMVWAKRSTFPLNLVESRNTEAEQKPNNNLLKKITISVPQNCTFILSLYTLILIGRWNCLNKLLL